ncbi:ABC-F family ATP-binding cassette domain-containing protein [Pseudodonghicola flavimaris]|uniref:ABC-F family ATP-binding cassette domain-containing protein n=1 Tax=Pseudodonghicola flavimaris TaxID=3050036 RepID=A0ABT7EXE5_9RHOB|nr:ABC-F family ATP-binding cassette domain-containing protein [Pseudodonghicola flavimaris]MDK3017014.1 ABC-F family ATP-binding cassette domain-containing protein [Pseudodonghicola flavimaris]
MPASVSLSNLSWATPDGSPLFHDLTLSFDAERTGIVGRNGTGKSTLLKLISGELQPTAGRVIAPASITMLRQEVAGHPDDTLTDLFGLRSELDLLDRAAAGFATAEELAEADWSLPARIDTALLRAGLAMPPDTPLAQLSGGQRPRAGLAALLLTEPEFLLLDEPTNTLDRAGRRAVIDLLHGWTGGAIVVSHDRESLEQMDTIVELTSLGATRYGGPYSVFRQQKALELEAARHELAHAEKTRTETARLAQQAAERKARKDRAGQRARAKGDQPKILMDAAKGWAETSDASNARLRKTRREAAETALTAARDRLEVLTPVQMDISPTGLPTGKMVLRLDAVTGGYDTDAPMIEELSLSLTGPERVVIAGPNGSGKTTLLKLITGEITPQRGEVQLMVPAALLDQHVTLLDPTQSLRENFRRLHPAADPRTAHAALARFGFRASDALRRASELSGGERLRAGLACALGATPPPMLLILDEPTNHLDLDSIAALEAALAAYDGALLVISHDEAFLQALGPHRTIRLKG